MRESTYRLLVVEDEAVVALDIEERLRRLGYQVVGVADSYADALEKAARQNPDLVLMDISLRDERDGIEAAERLRTELGIPVVFLTAFADSATLERAKRVSPYGYICKPFDERDLRTTVEIALHRNGVDQAIRRSHEDLLAILDVQRAGILLLDAGGVVRFANRAARGMLGGDAIPVMDREWSEALGLDAESERSVETALGARAAERKRVVARLGSRGERDFVVEIEVQDDPRGEDGRILLLNDVTELHDLRRLLDEQGRFHQIVGRSDAIAKVMRLVREVARVDATVLIEGETGTGKELVAKAIHEESERKGRPFVAVNCAGLPEELASRELFGHGRGAFTGAVSDAPGVFEAAQGGTLFLDEIGDLPPRIQVSLLRVLEERRVTRLGETKARPVDVRIVAATNRELGREVVEGRFRADLLYRIRVGRIRLPPLRDRLEDLPLLTRHLLSEQRATTGRPVDAVSDEAMRVLIAHSWPGNVRELKHALAYAVIHCRGRTVELEDLPPELLESPSLVSVVEANLPADERERILAALERTGGERKAAAALLGISRATLYRRLAHFGIP